ncbi:hypothetical protein LQ953_15955 [Sphingomonas sp. IC-56]|uniref:hypothetical protein n=1 Tax=Sphingomonas sp. IC-56 TaxID=2898529 RepID=UPI001E3BE503|nr:hypothetical protein [Sphingomonas sp. IC-56]MCD2325513.1 hypothetical protein [Sphingomonas sp. IC-56]
MTTTHITIRSGAALLAAALSLGATAAFATPVDPGKAPTASARVAAAKASPETKYCVVEAFTGSRVPRKQCRTRDDWIARDGFDPLAAKK